MRFMNYGKRKYIFAMEKHLEKTKLQNWQINLIYQKKIQEIREVVQKDWQLEIVA